MNILSFNELTDKLKLLTQSPLYQELYKLALNEHTDIYIVGGFLRNTIIGRSTKDIDFAVSNDAISFAKKFAKISNSTFVLLDDENNVARIIPKTESIFFDFAQIRGNNIIDDVKERDFTINTIVVDFKKVFEMQNTGYKMQDYFIDYYNGVEDIKNRIVRAVSEKSIQDDPLRMIRAVRFSAELNFEIEKDTIEWIKINSTLLHKVSVERIMDELFKILCTSSSLNYIKFIDEMNLLSQFIPEIESMKGVEQGRWHHLDVWEHSLLVYENFEKLLNEMSNIEYRISNNEYRTLNNEYRIANNELSINNIQSSIFNLQSRKWFVNYNKKIIEYFSKILKNQRKVGLLKLSALLHDIGKPITKTVGDDGKIHFYTHEVRGGEIIFEIGKRLRLSNDDVNFLRKIVSNHLYPLGFVCAKRVSKISIIRFFRKLGDDWILIMLFSICDVMSKNYDKDDFEKLNSLADRMMKLYFEQIEPAMKRPVLITGDDLIKEFGLKPGPIFGKLLKRIEEEQISGKINTKDEAMILIRKLLTKE